MRKDGNREVDPLDIEKTLFRSDGATQEKPTSAYTLSPGQSLGQYRIIRPLGRGGMGEVYEAENAVSRKRVALKVLPRAATGGTFVERFRIESRVMSDLRHPNIVEVLHAGEENGLYYLTMDLITAEDGEPCSLEDVLQHRTSNTEHPTSKAKGLPESEVAAAAEQILTALEYAHGKGVVHRDLKPANILVAEDGTLRVTDFGLAKVVGAEYLQSVIERSISLSMAGGASLGDEETEGGAKRPSSSARALLGTYDYMAPEQKTGGEITVCADIYAFGVMLYRLLTGEKPEGRWKLPSSYGVSKRWDTVVGKCMERSPADRYASVSELRRDILKVRTVRRTCSWKWSAALLFLTALAFGGHWAYRAYRAHAERRAAAGRIAAERAEREREFEGAISAARVVLVGYEASEEADAVERVLRLRPGDSDAEALQAEIRRRNDMAHAETLALKNESARADIETLLNAAVAGDADAQFELGLHYAQGEGVEQDMRRAILWWIEATRQAHPKATARLEDVIDEGIYLPQDAARAEAFRRRALEWGGAIFVFGRKAIMIIRVVEKVATI